MGLGFVEDPDARFHRPEDPVGLCIEAQSFGAPEWLSG